MRITVSTGDGGVGYGGYEYGDDALTDVPGLTITKIWPTEEFRRFRRRWTDEQVEEPFLVAVPEGRELYVNPRFHPSWHVVVWEGERTAIEAGLTLLLQQIDRPPGDYWPTGVHCANRIATSLGGDWPNRVEALARRVTTQWTGGRLLRLAGYEPELRRDE